MTISTADQPAWRRHRPSRRALIAAAGVLPAIPVLAQAPSAPVTGEPTPAALMPLGPAQPGDLPAAGPLPESNPLVGTWVNTYVRPMGRLNHQLTFTGNGFFAYQTAMPCGGFARCEGRYQPVPGWRAVQMRSDGCNYPGGLFPAGRVVTVGLLEITPQYFVVNDAGGPMRWTRIG
jgi:hypothetical protein